MNAPDLTPEDTAAMRKTPGDFREYLRSEMARGRARNVKPAPKSAPVVPGRRVGAWPAGSRPPDPPPPVQPAVVQAALDEYRQWLADGQPSGRRHCECQPCQQLEGGTR